jgi:hypothetical protein
MPAAARRPGTRRQDAIYWRAQRVDAKEAPGRFPNCIARIDLVPTSNKLSQPRQRGRHRSLIERTFAFEAGQGRNAFDLGTPPRQYDGILGGERLKAPR